MSDSLISTADADLWAAQKKAELDDDAMQVRKCSVKCAEKIRYDILEFYNTAASYTNWLRVPMEVMFIRVVSISHTSRSFLLFATAGLSLRS